MGAGQRVARGLGGLSTRIGLRCVISLSVLRRYIQASMTPPDSPVRPAPNSDSLLVQRCVDGDKRAFDLLVIKYQRRVERLIGRMVRDVDVVPDIAQETFIRAYRALGQYRGDAQFYTWLYRIAVNTAKKRLMVMKRDPLVFAPDHDGDTDDETSGVWREPRSYASDGETPDAVLASREIAQAVNDAMAQLPLDLRTAIELRELEGLSYEEIAQAQGCPIGTVRSRIFRAREAISARIQPMLEHQTGKRW
jgi:RNA polymerase sigma-70 factor (ECF subfamily)